MPNMRFTTNLTLTKETKDTVKAAFAEAIALIPGKSEKWLMVIIEDNTSMYFAGNDEPCAMIAIELLGKADPAVYEKITAVLTQGLSKLLPLPPDRIYTHFSELTHWGWNGEHF